jgi:hypothetical protein
MFLPKLTPEQNEEFAAFVSTLPPRIQAVYHADLRAIWAKAKNNARIAANLESKRDTIAEIFQRFTDELEANELTLADLLAFERYERDTCVFPCCAAYTIPTGYTARGYRLDTAEPPEA